MKISEEQLLFWKKAMFPEIEEKDKEIERLNGLINIMELSLNKKNEVIKEVREFINNNSYESGDTSSMYLIDTDKLLEILKGSDKE